MGRWGCQEDLATFCCRWGLVGLVAGGCGAGEGGTGRERGYIGTVWGTGQEWPGAGVVSDAGQILL